MIPRLSDRRAFLGKLGKGAVAAAAVGAVGVEPFIGGKSSEAAAAIVPYNSAIRANAAYQYRIDMANSNHIFVRPQADNGDAARYTDYSGNFSKVLLHDGLGVPNHAAMVSLITAMQTGSQIDFANILIGTPGGGPNSRLNGPQVSLAYDLQGMDSHATTIPPAPTLRSTQTAAEQVEHYWAALLRDIPFADYASNSLVGQAVADMNSLSYLQGTSNYEFPFPVTRQNLFRGQIRPGDGNVLGPHISQFMVQPCYYGAQFLTQQYRTCLPNGAGGSDYMTSVSEYQLVQNGGDSGRQLVHDTTPRYMRAGRDLNCFTNVDVLYQAYFTAFLVLTGIGARP